MNGKMAHKNDDIITEDTEEDENRLGVQTSSSDTDEEEPGRGFRKSHRGYQKDYKHSNGRGSGRTKMLVFSPSAAHEGNWNRGQDYSHGRSRSGRHAGGEDRDEGTSSYRKNFRGKSYEKPNESLENYSAEDNRIGRQLRILSREMDEDNVVKICQQLQESFLVQENLRYIRYNLINIGSCLLDSFKVVSSAHARHAVAFALSRLGYVSDHDFQSFAKWILSAYNKEKNEKVCCSILDVLTELLKHNKAAPRLRGIDMHLLPGLQSALEAADTPDLFEAALNPVLLLALKYPTSFLQYFQDTVDILVGWFIDPSQPPNVAKTARKALQQLHSFWGKDLPFSLHLLEQFLEDLESYTAEANNLVTGTARSDTTHESFKKIASLLNVFAVIAAEVCSFKDSAVLSTSFLNLALSNISDCASNFLRSTRNQGKYVVVDGAVDNIVRAANECADLLVGWLEHHITSVSLASCLGFIKSQLEYASHFQYPLLVTILALMTKLIKVVSNQIAVETVQEWMKFSSQLIHWRKEHIAISVTRLFKAMINVRNVPLLIEVYRCIAADFEEAFTVLKQKTAPFNKILEAEEAALLLLSPLANLGRSSSFVGMWALQPSLLELLTNQLQPIEKLKFLTSDHPALFLGLIQVLYAHSKSHGHFVANSSLVNSQSGVKSLHTISPTSGNLTVMLHLLANACSELSHQFSQTQAKLLIMEWSTELLLACEPCTAQLNETKPFQNFLLNIVRFCATDQAGGVRLRRVTESALEAVLSLPQITSKTDLAVTIARTCISQLRSQSSAGQYVHLLGRCPPQVTLMALQEAKQHFYLTTQLASWINNESLIPARNFQLFFDFLLQGREINSAESFIWFHVGGTKQEKPVSICNNDILQWAAVQCALLCVNNKLRTPLGKPQETFLKIEDGIKSAARQDEKEELTEQNISKLIRIQLLLSFYEYLEKFMYNAYDGCSAALPLAPKAIRVFFRTNQTTCQEWVNRLSSAALTASVRAGRYASAARYGLHLLAQWSHCHRTIAISDLEQVLEHLLYSLIKLKARQQILGLKHWISEQQNLPKLNTLDFFEAAALHAENRFESAVHVYSNLYSSFEESKISNFINNQIIDCYTSLSDWEGLQRWKCDVAEQGLNGQMADLHALFDSNMHLEWPEKSPEIQWSAVNLMNDAKSSLLVAADRIRSTQSVYSAPETAWKIVELFMNNMLTFPQPITRSDVLTWLPLAHAMSHKDESVYSWMDNLHSVLTGASSTKLKFSTSSDSIEWARWLHWFLNLNPDAVDISTLASEMGLLTVSLAAKEGNVRLAERQLLHGLLSQGHDLPTLLMNEVVKMKMTPSSRLAIQMQLQGANLLHQTGDVEAAINVLTQCSLAVSRSLRNRIDLEPLPSYLAESFIILSKWLQQQGIPGRSLETLMELAGILQDDHRHQLEIDTKMIARKLLERATLLDSSSVEAWLAWGNFQYSAAESQEKITNIDAELLRNFLSGEELTKIVERSQDLKQNSEEFLTSHPVLSKKPAILKRVLEQFRSCQAIAATCYATAVEAYFKVIKMYSQSGDHNKMDLVHVTLRVLRVLVHEVGEDNETLQEILEREMDGTVPGMWRSLTPQLLSLLQHGKPWLRSWTSRLLSRIAIECSEHLLFPAAVGAAGLAWSWSVPQEESADDTLEIIEYEEDQENCKAAELQGVYKELMNRLNQKVPNMVSDVSIFLIELRRLVLLWDELWIATLQQIHPQVEQLLHKLNSQSQKLQKKGNLSSEHRKQLLYDNYQILFRPIIVTLETVSRITSSNPETPHEQWFHHHYAKAIEDGIQLLREASNVDRLQDLWLPFKNMFQQLQHICYRRTALKLDHVSPILATMKDTSIPLPGLSCNERENLLTINSIENVIIVLPTKTKPKKLVFNGSDGKRYAYLFKGMEDLHLDQRIMQFLSVSNVLLTKNETKSPNYRARHYGVIPLGPRSGLIQWVDGVTPLFGLYKRWLQRQASNSSTSKSEKDNATPAVPRPSELFYNKLTPLLEAEGLSSDPRHRSQWPLEVLRQVLKDLMEETPKDLVSRELWLGSFNAEQWWESTMRFGRSCAVMSVIGYIIGLGDRHLDNVLVDLHNGEVVHIDYNVCFEKGRQLRVPENVPFRLTANLQQALGPAGTGLEGTFRLSCIDVMKALRENRDLLLILLEHFVYDPLIDWKSQFGVHESSLIPLYVVNPAQAAQCSRQKRFIEMEATYDLFKLRSSELEPDWQENKQEMLNILPSLLETTDTYIEQQLTIQRLQDEIQDLHQDISTVFEIRANKNHVIRQAQQLQNVLLPLQAAYEAEQSMQLTLKEKLEESSKWIQLYQVAFSSLTTNQINQWRDLIRSQLTKFTTGFPLVHDFLLNSGQPNLAYQAETVEQQILNLKENQQSAAAVVVDLLSRYVSVAILYPSSHLEKHRTQLMYNWIKELESNFTAETCRRLATAFHEQLALDSPILAIRQRQIVAFELELGEILTEMNQHLHETTIACSAADLNTLTGDLMDSKEAVENFFLLHDGSTVSSTFLMSLCDIYQRLVEVEYNELNSNSVLENMSFQCGLASYVADFLSLDSQVQNQVKDELLLLQGLRQVYRDILELIYNGTAIVLPEMMRLFEAADSSVLKAFNELQTICLHMNSSKMEITKLQYQDLLSAAGATEDHNTNLAPGQMLLLGLNGLFDKLESSVTNVANIINRISRSKTRELGTDTILQLWNLINTKLLDNHEDKLLSERLLLMLSLFRTCSAWAAEFHGADVGIQRERFTDIFVKIALEWSNTFLTGLLRFTIALFCIQLREHDEQMTLDELVAKEMARFSSESVVVHQARELLQTVEDYWLKCEKFRLSQQKQEMSQVLLQLLQQQLTAHNWIHDVNPALNSPCSSFILELRQALSFLLSHSSQLTEMHQQVAALATQIEQRLKWASGANPSLNQLLKEFCAAKEECFQHIQECSSLATNIGGVSSALIHYETFRSRTPDALAVDTAFIQLLSRCQEICLLKECTASNSGLSETEFRVAKKIPVGSSATEEWINETEKSLSEMIQQQKNQLTELQLQQSACTDLLRNANGEMRSTLTIHHQLILDVRSVLKTMAKCECETGPVFQYLEKYRQFSELCSTLSRHLAARDYDYAKIQEIRSEISALQLLIDPIYDGLQQLSVSYKKPERSIIPKKRKEVNSIAASVWHRVRLKLEGRDPHPDKQLPVEQQVDTIISEATNLDNLALLYEGWTPWV